MDLPEELSAGIAAHLAGTSEHELAEAVGRMSSQYRNRPDRAPSTRLSSAVDLQAYLAYRAPATFAAIAAALQQVERRAAGWQPEHVLDVGAGPGAAAWAATEVWPELRRVTLVEKERLMVEAGRSLFASARQPALRSARWLEADVRNGWEEEEADLVLASYVLGELAPEERQKLVGSLWEQCAGVLVLAEPGTPSGFSTIRTARDFLITSGASIVAPCPHAGACPMAGGNWCHFAARVPRSGLHRRAKSASLGHEDEKFSYVAATRLDLPPGPPRVVRHPQVRSGHVYFELCTDDGLQRRVVSRREGEAYRKARQTRWGDVLER